jgi:hypothetical protein
MDPDEALRTLRRAISEYWHAVANDDVPAERDAGHDAVEAAEALDGWLSKGGFLPSGWILADPPPISDAEHAEDVRTVARALRSDG